MGDGVFAGAAFWDKAASGTRTQGLFRFDKGVSIECTRMNIGPTWRTFPLAAGVSGVYAVACA